MDPEAMNKNIKNEYQIGVGKNTDEMGSKMSSGRQNVARGSHKMQKGTQKASQCAPYSLTF